MEDHSYFPSSNSSQYFWASFHGTSSRSGAMLSTTPSLRSGSRCRLAARRNLPSKSCSSEMNCFLLGRLSFCEFLDASCTRGTSCCALDSQWFKAAFFQPDFGLDVVHQGLEERVGVDPRVVEPQSIGSLARLGAASRSGPCADSLSSASWKSQNPFGFRK